MHIIVEISGRHAHLSQEDCDTLFGKGHGLTPLHPISQRGQYATKETIKLKAPKGEIARLRIVGPVRTKSQVELSTTDARVLGIAPHVRLSGSLKGTPGCMLIGPKGKVVLKEGVIIPRRHIHASPAAAKKAGLRNKALVAVSISGARAVEFHNVIVRIHPTYRWHCHLDTDEGNAAGLTGKGRGVIIKNNK